MLPVWTLKGTPVSGSDVHLAAISRSVGAGDIVLIAQPGRTTWLIPVLKAADVVWYANPDGNDPAVKPASAPMPVPHTQLTLGIAMDAWWVPSEMRIGVGWIEIGRLVDQDPAPWSGTPATLEAVPPARFDAAVALPALVADADGRGVPAALSALAGASSATVSVDEAYAESLPLDSPLNLLTQLVEVTRGKTVAHEVLGSGDARLPDQSFTLAKSPVTYLRRGASYASSVTILVNGEPWQEVESFYGQAASAAIFTLREDEKGKTLVQFGDGINGRRLPSGVDNVVATYRYGSGADSPGQGKLTRIVKSLTGLAKLRNPVAAGGGSDPEPADEIRRYAPRSVLTFGRAVSPADYQAIAAQATAPDRVHAVWAWDDVRQRAAITVYVAGGPDKLATVRDVLKVAGDPHRPVAVEAATPVELGLALTLLVAPGYEADPILAAATEALTGEAGLFSADRMGIGQYLFNSALSAALLPIPGVVTLLETRLVRDPGGNAVELHGNLHRVDQGEWFDLSAAALSIAIEVSDG
jgi:predicted phage baseplate assembly protein